MVLSLGLYNDSPSLSVAWELSNAQDQAHPRPTICILSTSPDDLGEHSSLRSTALGGTETKN